MDAELQFCPVSQPPWRSCGSQLSLRQVERPSHSREDHICSHAGWQNLQKGAQILKKKTQFLPDVAHIWSLLCVKMWIIGHMWICVWWQLARTYSYAHSWMHNGWNCGDFFDVGITNGASWYSLSKGKQKLWSWAVRRERNRQNIHLKKTKIMKNMSSLKTISLILLVPTHCPWIPKFPPNPSFFYNFICKWVQLNGKLERYLGICGYC